MTTHVALLRGINVGGANRLPMKSLLAAFEQARARRAVTLIQSGNVVFDAEDAAQVADEVSTILARDFGLRAPIVTRSAAAWRRMFAGNPFLPRLDPAQLHVAVLSAKPAASAMLDPARSPADAFALIGDTLYLHLPNGVSGSKITNAWLDSRLGVISTLRNWATVTRLAAVLDERPSCN